MDLSLAHQLVLLDLDDTRGVSLTHGRVLRRFAVGGALVAELNLMGRLVPVAAHRFAMVEGPPLPGVLGQAAALLPPGERPLERCVNRVGAKGGALRDAILAEFVEAGALRQERDTFLRIPWRTRFPEGDGAAERSVVAHLRMHLEVVTREQPLGREDLLISLLSVCGILEAVWSREEVAGMARLLEERASMAPIGAIVRKVVKVATEA